MVADKVLDTFAEFAQSQWSLGIQLDIDFLGRVVGIVVVSWH